MNENEFDSAHGLRSFGSADVAAHEESSCRSTALGIALWGRTFDDLRRQLLAPRPTLPEGFALADFRQLEKHARTIQEIAANVTDPQFAFLSRSSASASRVIAVGPLRFTLWEARCEVVRRAIEWLEKR